MFDRHIAISHHVASELQYAGRRAPGAVSFLGHVGDRETPANIFANCDTFIHPNPREPFGIVTLEPMASGPVWVL